MFFPLPSLKALVLFEKVSLSISNIKHVLFFPLPSLKALVLFEKVSLSITIPEILTRRVTVDQAEGLCHRIT